MSDNLTEVGSNVPDLTEDELDLLRRAGASDATIRMCKQSIEGVVRPDGKEVDRHSVLQECKKYVRGTGSMDPFITEENAEEFSEYGGSLFSHIWSGDLHDAYGRADPNNVALMEAVFSPVEVNRTRNQSWKQTVTF